MNAAEIRAKYAVDGFGGAGDVCFTVDLEAIRSSAKNILDDISRHGDFRKMESMRQKSRPMGGELAMEQPDKAIDAEMEKRWKQSQQTQIDEVRRNVTMAQKALAEIVGILDSAEKKLGGAK